MSEKKKEYKPGDQGVCGFCGIGEGWLGEQGDEGSLYMHSAVRTGEPGNYKYEFHPGAMPDDFDPGKPGQTILWCGGCLGGLEHLFQRHDDHNLHAEHMALSFWLELDGPRWGMWEAQTDEERAAALKYQDDPSIHLDKLAREKRANLVQQELFRRAGAPMQNWRP